MQTISSSTFSPRSSVASEDRGTPTTYPPRAAATRSLGGLQWAAADQGEACGSRLTRQGRPRGRIEQGPRQGLCPGAGRRRGQGRDVRPQRTGGAGGGRAGQRTDGRGDARHRSRPVHRRRRRGRRRSNRRPVGRARRADRQLRWPRPGVVRRPRRRRLAAGVRGRDAELRALRARRPPPHAGTQMGPHRRDPVELGEGTGALPRPLQRDPPRRGRAREGVDARPRRGWDHDQPGAPRDVPDLAHQPGAEGRTGRSSTRPWKPSSRRWRRPFRWDASATRGSWPRWWRSSPPSAASYITGVAYQVDGGRIRSNL